MNKTQIAKFKKRLLAERKRIVDNAEEFVGAEKNLSTDDLLDEIDYASSESHRALNFRLRDRERFLLAKIDKALKKIDGGDFGVCEDCGDPIGVKRLEARPVTTLCIRCKEEEEREEKGYA